MVLEPRVLDAVAEAQEKVVGVEVPDPEERVGLKDEPAGLVDQIRAGGERRWRIGSQIELDRPRRRVERNGPKEGADEDRRVDERRERDDVKLQVPVIG